MKIDINVLRTAMFMIPQQKLNLDTGEISYASFEDVLDIKREKLIPTLSSAPICQAYLQLLEQTGIIDSANIEILQPRKL